MTGMKLLGVGVRSSSKWSDVRREWKKWNIGTVHVVFAILDRFLVYYYV